MTNTAMTYAGCFAPACACFANTSDHQPCSACASEACAHVSLSKKDALKASFFVLVSILCLFRLCILHIAISLLISLRVWKVWKTAEVH